MPQSHVWCVDLDDSVVTCPVRSLDQLVDRDMLSGQVAAVLQACVAARCSIVFAGPPGSGKTTLLSCTAAEIDPGLRVVVAEEVFEAEIPVPNVAQMQTRGARGDRPAVDLRRLVAGFLRMAPDVAIVGEVPDGEGFPGNTSDNRHARHVTLPEAIEYDEPFLALPEPEG